MRAAVWYVERNPGLVMRDIAKKLHIGAYGRNNALGYEPIWRAVRAGLLVTRPGARRGTRVLYTPEQAAEL